MFNYLGLEDILDLSLSFKFSTSINYFYFSAINIDYLIVKKDFLLNDF